MADSKFFIDDRVVIPDDIKKMTAEELEAAIAQIEKELENRKVSA